MNLGRWLLLTLGLLACGGRISDVDGGLDAPSEAQATCTAGVLDPGGPINPGGACEVSVTWICGAARYWVQCTCGIAEKNPTCTCSQATGNEVTGGEGPSPSCMCTNGATAADLATMCGFPH